MVEELKILTYQLNNQYQIQWLLIRTKVCIVVSYQEPS